MTELPADFAFNRQWGIESVNLSRYVSLNDNWQKSTDALVRIRNTLASAGLPNTIKTIAAAGSLARMEASEESDADLIIVVDDRIEPDSAEDALAYASVWKALDFLGIKKPNKGGVFSITNRTKDICGSNIGHMQEELRVFGKRLLLLLESQPVYEDNNYSNLIDLILDRYAMHYVKTDPQKEWVFLINDLLRYFRALCVNYQWSFLKDPVKWPIRNVKLRHSRLIMYAGLLFLLGESSKEREDKLQWMRDRLFLTPLERIVWVYEENRDWSLHRVAGLYNVFLSRLNDPEVRKELHIEGSAAAKSGNSYPDRHRKLKAYADLKANSDALIAELLRFVLARRGTWSERFYEYLIF